MAYIFGDSFDFYAATADALAGHWDSGGTNWTLLTTGRFAGSQSLRSNTSGVYLTKSSGSNDAVHHFVCAFQQTATLSGTTAAMYLQLLDGTTNQCCIVFRSDGAMLLTSGGPTGTTLATYAGAVSAQNTWTAFECEVVIHNTAGSFIVRKNGNTGAADFSATSLNTRGGTANNYANKLTVGTSTAISNQLIDDLLWRSDASSVAWVGDIRAYQLLPASDASAQFSRSPSPYPVIPNTGTSTASIVNGTARYTPFTAPVNGTLNTVSITLAAGYTGNMKCSLFTNAAGVVTTVIASATAIVNPVSGANTFTFSSPPTLVKGTSYYLGFISDTSSGTWQVTAATAGFSGTGVSYAAFPSGTPVTSAAAGPIITANITPTASADYVSEAQQDGTTTYVYDSTVGHADLYNISPLPLTPTLIVGVNLRGFMAKSDAGSRSGQLQMKSGSTTVQSTPLALSTSFLWNSRFDTVDPNTSTVWTAAGVNAVQIGPVVQA